MAKRKIDEQVSYNKLFVVLASGFSLVTIWAVYDEVVSRREWKSYQERFFRVEQDLTHKQVEDQEAILAGTAGTPEQKKSAARYAELTKKKAEIEADVRTRANDVARLDVELAAAKQVEFDKNQNLTFTKSEWAEQDYYTKEARRHALVDPSEEKKAEAATQQTAFDRLAKRVDSDQTALMAAIDARKAVEAKIAKVRRADELGAITKEMDGLRHPLDDAKRRYGLAEKKTGGLFGDKTEVRQQDLPAIGAVDRCESCHMAASRGGFEEVAETVFRSHPFRRTLLATHPPEVFGCTTCHDGQGRATIKFFAHAPSADEDAHAFHKHYWEFPLLKGPPGGDGTEYMESKCRGCHPTQIELRSTIVCEIDAECAPAAPIGPDGKKQEATCKVAKLENRPAAQHSFDTLPGTPPPPATDAPTAEETKMCVDRRGNALVVDLVPHYARGVQIVEEAGCFGCHPIEGFRDLPKPAPDLTRVAHKLDPGWMVRWIENPKELRPNTRMPKFWPELDHPEQYPFPVDVAAEKQRREHEARALVAFLLDRSRQSKTYAYETEAIPAGVSGDAARGKDLVGALGCIACHEMPKEIATPKRHNRGSHFDHGPNLSDMGAKATREWIYSWVRNPKRYAPATRMPNLRLTPQEAADVAEYLSRQKGEVQVAPLAAADLADPGLVKEGEGLVRKYGCYGCHTVEGFETTVGIGADLSAFGVKLPERLDFGDFIVDHNLQTWDAWTIAKLRHPRVYSYRGQSNVETRMPEFGLTEEEVRDVMVFLRSLRGDEVSSTVLRQKLTVQQQARETGRALVRYYNCYGCHNVDGHTGEVASLFAGEQDIYGPPPLTNEGLKAQPSWLFTFLKKPFRMRPLPRVRMPTFAFTDVQATSVVAMFSALDNTPFPYAYYADAGARGPGEKTIGKAMFDTAGCQKCHVVGELGDGPVPPEVKAPNLAIARQRLRPEWTELWLADPGSLQKGTSMPAFWLAGNPMKDTFLKQPEFQAAIQGVDPALVQRYAESPQLQIDAVRDYLFELGRPEAPGGASAPPAAAAATPSPGP